MPLDRSASVQPDAGMRQYYRKFVRSHILYSVILSQHWLNFAYQLMSVIDA